MKTEQEIRERIQKLSEPVKLPPNIANSFMSTFAVQTLILFNKITIKALEWVLEEDTNELTN